jgi:hypothetical protein
MSNPITLPVAGATDFSDTSDKLSPTFLLGPNGKAYRYAMSLMYRALADAAAYGVLFRFPDRAPSDAIAFMSADRQMVQGFAESQASFASRAKQWLDVWGFAGTPTGILLEELGYCLPALPEALTVDNRGQWWTYAAGAYPLAPPPASIPTPPVQTLPHVIHNWQWDSVVWPPAHAALWSRMWVVIFSPSGSPFATPTATSGGGNTCGDGTCCGWAGTAAQASGLTKIARLMAGGHVCIPFVIVSYDSTMFDSSLSFGSAKLPDGNWRWASKVVANQYVPARPSSTTCSFLLGTTPTFG